MPPCHGGDRRFESGRARQIKNVTLCGVFYLGRRVCDVNRSTAQRPVRRSEQGERRSAPEVCAIRSNHTPTPSTSEGRSIR
jgi:hypothetical protein